MRFGLLYELQLPRPWDERAEHRMIHEALAEVELADRLGFDYLWANEHHFLEEYSHSSAPEVFLAAAAARTKQIHVGQAVVLSPPGYNPPARVAERIATLDLVSSGRCRVGHRRVLLAHRARGLRRRPDAEEGDVGGGDRADRQHDGDDALSRLRGQVLLDADAQRDAQAVAEAAPADLGRLLQPRDHPCPRRATASARSPSPSSIRPRRRSGRANTTRSSSRDECVPIGHAVNANIAMVTGFSVHHDEAEATARGGEGFQFFGFALGHFYVYGQHKPGVTNVWERFEAARAALPPAARQRHRHAGAARSSGCGSIRTPASTR